MPAHTKVDAMRASPKLARYYSTQGHLIAVQLTECMVTSFDEDGQRDERRTVVLHLSEDALEEIVEQYTTAKARANGRAAAVASRQLSARSH